MFGPLGLWRRMGSSLLNPFIGSWWMDGVPIGLLVFFGSAKCQNKLQAAQILKRRVWKGNGNYILCGVLESIDHFFKCHISCFAWGILRETFGWSSVPHSRADFFTNWLRTKQVIATWMFKYVHLCRGLMVIW